jgi:hypothetical protein
MAVRNVQFMAAKQITIGSMAHRHSGRRTMGSKSNEAKTARQKAIVDPRSSAGMATIEGALASTALVLQRQDAKTTSTTPQPFLGPASLGPSFSKPALLSIAKSAWVTISRGEHILAAWRDHDSRLSSRAYYPPVTEKPQ